MHGALVAKNYKTALSYCNTSKNNKYRIVFRIFFYELFIFVVLTYEQQNVTMRTFQELLTRKLEISELHIIICYYKSIIINNILL